MKRGRGVTVFGRAGSRVSPRALTLLLTFFAVLLSGSTLGRSAAFERPIHRLAHELARSELVAQQDFALAALGEMANEYEGTLERVKSRRERDPRKSYKRHRWLRATEIQLQELYALMTLISDGEPVQIVADAPAAVQIVAASRTVLVSSIHDSDPRQLESRVMRSYCDMAGCDTGHLGPLAELAQSDARWTFADRQGNVFRTDDGLRFMFSDLRGRRQKAAVCERAASDLRLLAEQLAATERSGVDVEWDLLAVHGAERGLIRVRLNRAGDLLKLHLPAIKHAPDLVSAARRWLEARAHGREIELILPGAELMLARLLLAG